MLPILFSTSSSSFFCSIHYFLYFQTKQFNACHVFFFFFSPVFIIIILLNRTIIIHLALYSNIYSLYYSFDYIRRSLLNLNSFFNQIFLQIVSNLFNLKLSAERFSITFFYLDLYFIFKNFCKFLAKRSPNLAYFISITMHFFLIKID